jgi:hypothetical protein
MRVSTFTTLLLLLAITCGFASAAKAATFCVSNVAELHTALVAASNNSENNTIKVVAGTYNSPSGGFLYFRTSGNFDFDLEGGWNAGCTIQTPKASLTTLDGQSTHVVLALFGNTAGLTGNLTLRYFDVYHGANENGYDAALQMYAYGGDVRIESCRFRNNVADTSSLMSIASHSGTITFAGNVVANNSAPGEEVVVTLNVNNDVGAVYVNNNTIADNVFASTVTAIGAVKVNRATLSNNILINDGKREIYAADGPLLLNNDIDFISATPGAGSADNIDVDPQFVSTTDHHIALTSPVRDAGDNTPPGGLPVYDLDGRQRKVFGRIDMGAYEAQGDNIFSDGFEH